MFPVQSRMKKLFPVLVLLLFLPLTQALAIQPPKTGEGSIDAAIAAVYPSLVQIYVLTTQPQEGRERKFQASGSGAIISSGGHVITNHHVAGKAVAIRCVLSTKEEIDATLVGTDPLTDISVVKLDLSSRRGNVSALPVAKFGRPGTLKVGEVVLAMGCPLAISQSVTKGIVSNTNMIFPKMMTGGLTLDGEDVGSMVKWIGHDASIFPGNSGGPLVNLQGEIVGINEIGYGLSGAIPADLASAVSQELIRNGTVRRAWIGANFQPLLKSGLASAAFQGVLVSGVMPESPAEKAGLQAGDLVTALNSSAVHVRFQEELPGFIRQVVSLPLDQPMELKIRRSGKEMLIEITPELRDEAMGKELELKEWGMTARRLTRVQARELSRPDTRGVLVGSIRQGGPANMAMPPLKSMDVIVEVAGNQVSNLDSLRAITAELTQGKTEPVSLLVAFERSTEKELSVVEVGIRLPQEPPAEVKKAWLPVATQVLSKKLASALGLKGKKGVRITQVFPESAAEQAGFKVGDVITHVDDQQVEASEPHDGELFESVIWAYKVDSTAEFTVLREGKPLKITATLGEAPKAERELRVYEDLAFEFKARDLSYLDRVKNYWSKDQEGALVSQVDSGGWAAVAGLRTDDLIQSVDGKPVGAVKDLEAILEQVRSRKPKQVVFFLKRGIYTHFVEIEPTWREKQ